MASTATSNLLRASVMPAGANYCPNPGPAQNVSLYTGLGTFGRTADPAIVTWTDAQPAPNPIGEPGCGLITWSAETTSAVQIPTSELVVGQDYTVSTYLYVPGGNPSVRLAVDALYDGSGTALAYGAYSTATDTFVRISVTFTATETLPVLTLEPDYTQLYDSNGAGWPTGMDPAICYWAGVLISDGDALTAWNSGTGQAGDPVSVLIDGADTPVTANGLSGYASTPGDRLLVTKVGSVVEVVQYLSRGTVPYLVGTDLSDLSAAVDANTQAISDTQDTVGANYDDLTGQVATTNTNLTQYQATNDAAVSSLQSAYDPLTGIGAAGVFEDYFWVGDDPTLSSVKLVQISTFVQSALYAEDGPTLATLLDLVHAEGLGDVTFSDGVTQPPMTTFYQVLQAAGITVIAWNA